MLEPLARPPTKSCHGRSRGAKQVVVIDSIDHADPLAMIDKHETAPIARVENNLEQSSISSQEL